MPGSKRRALKKLLSPHSDAGSPSPAPSSIPSDTALPALDDGGAAALSESAAVGGDGGGATSAGASVKSGRSSSLRSSFSLHGRHKPKVAPPPAGTPLQPADSAVSMSSVQSGGSAMSVSEQESLLEEMSSREGTIGTGQHRASDGVPDLNSPSPAGSVPEPATASSPRKKSFGASAGGMYGGNFMQGFGTGGKGKKSSRQRFEERQAKKKQALLESAPPSDPSWTAQLEKERQEEIRVISDACEVLGREIFEIPPDGHCMYHAVADQLGELGLISPKEATDPRFTRSAAAKYMLAHKDDFMPFLASIDGEDTAAAASHEGLMTEDEFSKYCFNVAETGEWGGEPEIQALSRAFKVPIHVVQRGPPTIVSHGGSNDGFGGGLSAKESLSAGDKVVRISYHRRMYGLGEHYNSLRKA